MNTVFTEERPEVLQTRCFTECGKKTDKYRNKYFFFKNNMVQVLNYISSSVKV